MSVNNKCIVSPVFGSVSKITGDEKNKVNVIEIYIKSSQDHTIYSPISGRITRNVLEEGCFERKQFSKLLKHTQKSTWSISNVSQGIHVDLFVEFGIPNSMYSKDSIKLDKSQNDFVSQGTILGKIFSGSTCVIKIPMKMILNVDYSHDFDIGTELEGKKTIIASQPIDITTRKN